MTGINQTTEIPSYYCCNETRNETSCFWGIEEKSDELVEEKVKTERKKQGQIFFPCLLHDIVSEESYSEVIRWKPDGKAFIIVDKKIFLEKILPRYFPNVRKFSSFARRLTRWHFQEKINA